MDWRRTKTIFIFAFLIVNVFLGLQLIEKRNENQFEYISRTFLEIEDQLKSMDITYPDLPDEPKKLVYIIGQMHTFSEEEYKDIKKPGSTMSSTEDNKMLVSAFDQEKSLPDKKDEIAPFLQPYTLFSDEYVYSEYLSDEDDSQLTFIQTYDERPIYQKKGSANGQIHIKLNNDGEMVNYVQTYLDTNPQGSEQDLLTAIKAINQLFNSDKLKQGDEITFIELGYYSNIEGDVQVLAPTWLIEVNEDQHYYVNAVNGLVADPSAELNNETGESAG